MEHAAVPLDLENSTMYGIWLRWYCQAQRSH